MNKHTRLIEWGKNLLIVFLIISSVLLLQRTDYYNSVFDKIEGFFNSTRESIQTDKVSSGSDSVSFFVQPMSVSVSVGQGNRYAAIYNSETVSADFQRFSAFLGEALGSSSEPQEIGFEQWKEALTAPGVLIQLYAPQPLSSISDLLGTEMSGSAGSALADMICMNCSGNEVRLYYKNSDSVYYSCTTGVSAELFSARLAEFVPNGAELSHELSSLAGLEQTMLIPGVMPVLPRLDSTEAISLSRVKSAMFSSLEINEYTVSEYSESDGTLVFLDDSCTLRISSNGAASYSLNDNSPFVRCSSAREAMNICWEIISSGLLPNCGEASLYLSGISADDEKANYTLTFDYSHNGIPVCLGDNSHAAEFKFRSGWLSYAQFIPKGYVSAEETAELLPMLQAAAISLSSGKGGIELIYSDSGEKISCMWVSQ